MKTTTIYQIAKELRISSSTVSRALKGHPDISPKTRERVLEMAVRLDYEPNMFAVSLRKNSSKEIAIIAPTLSGFYYDSFISAVEFEAKKLGYSVIVLLSGDDPIAERQNLKTCRQRRVACIMICITSKTLHTEIFESIQSSDIPLIFFDKVPDFAGVKSVCSDDFAAAAIAANELLCKNKVNSLSIFGDPNFSITRIRQRAFEQTFLDVNASAKIQVVHASSSAEAENAVVQAFQNYKPDSIFCMSDEILIGAMKAVQILALKIPEEVSIISISNGFFPRLYFPEITYVETSGFKLGQLVMDLFYHAVQGHAINTNSILNPILVRGGSI
jgi:LacI family transcriptional regulator